MPAIPIHDFECSLEAARVDAELQAQLKTFLNSDTLTTPNKGDLVKSSCSLANIALGEARALYAQNPERLVCVISASTMPNAFAIWTSLRYDWVVLTEGLLRKLRDSAENMVGRIEERFPEILQSSLVKRILSRLQVPQGFQTSLGYLLYSASIGFFVGHEVGHHLGGHDGHYRNRAQSQVARPCLDMETLTDQALEFQADRDGALIGHLTLGRFLLECFELPDLRDRERRLYERMKALLVSAGALMALVIFHPRPIDWTYTAQSTHPPAVLRAIGISAVLTSIFRKLNHLSERERRRIRINTLEFVAQIAIVPKSAAEQAYQQRSNRGEPAALRAIGIRAALYDPKVKAYIMAIEPRLEAVQARLLPRRK